MSSPFPSCLVILTLLASCSLGSSLIADENENEGLEALRRVGGAVTKVRGDGDEWEVEFHIRGRDVTDTQLAPIAKLNSIGALNLRDTRITDEGVAHLSGLTNLRSLHLERTQLTDRGTAHLTKLTRLEYLNIYGTAVTDASVEHLAKLKSLRRLYVWQTKITEAGAKRLQEAIPGLVVERGIDLANLPVMASGPPRKPAVPLKWMPVSDAKQVPQSRNGQNTQVTFRNESGKHVKVYWKSYSNQMTLYGELAPGGTRDQNTYANNYWVITDVDDKPLGYFLVGGDEALAVIPKS